MDPQCSSYCNGPRPCPGESASKCIVWEPRGGDAGALATRAEGQSAREGGAPADHASASREPDAHVIRTTPSLLSAPPLAVGSKPSHGREKRSASHRTPNREFADSPGYFPTRSFRVDAPGAVKS
jgi:hypothetical protein